MSKRYVVFITYGVYVGADEYDEEYIIRKAVEKMFTHDESEVAGSCDAEIEDITQEFEED